MSQKAASAATTTTATPGAIPQSRAQFPWALVVLLLVFLAGADGLSLLYLRQLERKAQNETRVLLNAVADLKERQITRWRAERLADAHLVSSTPYFARRALDFIAQPSETSRGLFTSSLGPLMAIHACEQLLLLDTNLEVRLTQPRLAAAPELPDSVRGAAKLALETRQVVVADLCRQSQTGDVHLGVLVPFVVRRGITNDLVPAAGTPPSARDRSAAVLVLLINAKDFLFPLLEAWPTPSRTAETFLVRRDGDGWLVLTHPRHRPHAAFSLRQPAGAVPQGTAGGTPGGLGDGLDYRGVPVMSVARPVPKTTWFVVAKMDQEEVRGALRQPARMIWGSLGLLTVTCALGVALLWRRQEAQALRKRLGVERERLAQAARVHYLMKNAHDIILLATEDFRIVEANDRALESYGYSMQELLQLSLPQLRAPGERASLPQLVKRLQVEGGALFETLHQRKDQATFAVEGSVRRVEIDGVCYYLCIFRDVTDRKRLEEKLREAQKLESIGQLAGGVAHHFNNILAIILLQLDLLKLEAKLDPETREALEAMEVGAKRAADLTRELLTFGRLSTLELKILDLNSLIRNMLPRLEELAGPRIQLILQPAPALPTLEGDTPMLQQLVTNLAANACDAMPQGGQLTLATAMVTIGEEQARMDLDLRPGQFICLTVTDTGCGMDAATIKHLFEPFFTTKEVGRGTGLGLATVYGAAILHKGWVSVQSQAGQGTSFRVFFPVNRGVAAPVG